MNLEMFKSEKVQEKVLCIPFKVKNQSGLLFLYGEHLPICKDFIENMPPYFKDLCEYCKTHGIKIFFKKDKTLGGFIANIKICRTTKKFKIYSTWDNFLEYVENIVNKK